MQIWERGPEWHLVPRMCADLVRHGLGGGSQRRLTCLNCHGIRRAACCLARKTWKFARIAELRKPRILRKNQIKFSCGKTLDSSLASFFQIGLRDRQHDLIYCYDFPFGLYCCNFHIRYNDLLTLLPSIWRDQVVA